MRQSIKCGHCNKLLAMGEAVALEIKCPRCKTINHVRTKSSNPERQERQGENMDEETD